MRIRAFVGVLTGLAIILWPAGDGRAATDVKQELMAADRDFDRATAEKGVDGWVSFFAENGRMYSGGEIVQGREAIRKLMSPMFSTPGNSLRWHPVAAEVGKSGDLGYTTGESQRHVRGPDGKVTEGNGRFVTIWRRQKDRSWKVELDIGSPGPSRPAAGQ